MLSLGNKLPENLATEKNTRVLSGCIPGSGPGAAFLVVMSQDLSGGAVKLPVTAAVSSEGCWGCRVTPKLTCVGIGRRPWVLTTWASNSSFPKVNIPDAKIQGAKKEASVSSCLI